MNGAIGHRGRQVAGSRTLVPAPDAGGMPVCVPSVFRRRGTVPAGFSNALLWLATTGMAIAAPAASTWSLLPQPVDARLAPSGVVKIVDGALVAVRGADSNQVQPTVDRVMQLVANTRGVQFHAATRADPPPATQVGLGHQ